MASKKGDMVFFNKQMLLFCLALLLGAEQVTGAALSRPNVILITVDCLRPDHLGYYGYPLDTSPNLDQFSREGAFFRQAFSSSGWTSPGLISLLTSLHPPTHGIDIRGRRLNPEVVTLPDVLIEAGYRAPDILFLTDIPNFSNLGLQPYARRDEFIYREDEIFFHWLTEEAAASDDPFFLYYHYRDVHQPFNPAEPYESMFLPQAFASRWPLVSAFRRFVAAEKMKVVKTHIHVTRGLLDFRPADRPWVRALYDGQVRQLDEQFFGRLRQTLEEQGLLDNTLVIVSADHGEELLDRDLIGHVSTFKEGRLYDEIVRIPLILWFPGVLPAGRVVEETVSCLDVMPTLLELLDLPFPSRIQGQSLLPLLDGRREWNPRPVFFETSAGGYTADEEQYSQRFRAVRTDRWKLISSPGERYELYDLDDDSQELRNVFSAHPQVADSLQRLLNEWILFTLQSPYPPVELDIDMEEGDFGDRLEVLFPQDGDTLHYQGSEHVIQLRWTGPPHAAYAIEYEVGEGTYYLEGILTESGSTLRYGPFQPFVWDSLVLYNPWRFRVYPLDRPAQKSDWVTFHVAGSRGAVEGSSLGMLFHLRHGAFSVLVHAFNLVSGLGRGMVDLYWWTAGTSAASAAQLVAYGLLLAIVAAILWPYLQRRLGAARCRAWGLAFLYIAFVYSTVPLLPKIFRVLREYTDGSIRYLGIVAVAGAGVILSVKLWRRVRLRRWQPYVALLIIVPIYGYLLKEYALFPAERLHLVQYGFMGWVLFRALRLDLSEYRAYGASFLATVMVGIGDECLQWFLPQRFFELSDIYLNAISGALGLLVLRFVVEPGRDEKQQQHGSA